MRGQITCTRVLDVRKCRERSYLRAGLVVEIKLCQEKANIDILAVDLPNRGVIPPETRS